MERTGAGDDPPRSVLLVTADTLRANYCSPFGGHVEMPRLQELADGGALFAHTYSLSPWTMPSIAGLMSSRYPLGPTPNVPMSQTVEETVSYAAAARYWEEPDGSTFVTRLRDAGFETAALIGNPFIKKHEWLMKGFDHTVVPEFRDGLRGELLREPRGPFRAAPALRGLLARAWPALGEQRDLDSTRVLTEHARLLLHKFAGKPFFLWIHYYDPHTPFDAPEQFRTEPVSFTHFPPPEMIAREPLEKVAWEHDHVDEIRSMYEAEVRYLDHATGLLIDDLGTLGLRGSTNIVFNSDHGEELIEHTGVIAHGHTFYEELIWVPLILSGPDVPQVRVAEASSAIDVLPTMAAWLGQPAQAGWRGRDLTERMASGLASDRPVFAQSNSTFAFKEPKQAVVWRNHKLIYGMATRHRELYNLKTDPLEKHNLVDEVPELADQLQILLEDWSDSFPSTYARLEEGDKPSLTPEEMEDSIQNLQSLGYLGGDPE
jgi:arylsulfatase A-like enzyme